MKTISRHYYKTDYAEFVICSFEDKICMLDYRYRKKRDAVDRRIAKGLDGTFVEQESAVIVQMKVELDAYFRQERQTFSVPILMVGTAFQKEVWQALLEIPYGQTSSYGVLSQKMGKPKAVRAVANANGANAMSIIIPCHRIIGSDGSLTGYAGGLAVKRHLLELENSLFCV